MIIGPLHYTVAWYKKLYNFIIVPWDWVLQRAYYQLVNVVVYSEIHYDGDDGDDDDDDMSL